MNRKNVLQIALFLSSMLIFAQDWSGIVIPANAGSGKTWLLQDYVSDDFNYNFDANNNKVNFGNNKWYNFYHNPWDGPGRTYWKPNNVKVDGGNLVINVGYTSENSKGGSYGVASGCVKSNSRVSYPVYVESAVSVANISLASCFWLLSPDDTEEIDIIENYGGVDDWKHLTHISHHSFVRDPFTDYQPRDVNSWYPDSRVSPSYGWGDWAYNNGNRRYVRMGVNWIGPKHFEYFIDGELIRVMYYNAIATKYNGNWQYTYFNSMNWVMNGFNLPTNNGEGYTDVTMHSTSDTYNFDTLKAASNASNGYNVIDPAWFQGGDDNDMDGNGITLEAKGFTKEMDIIINIESQDWLLDKTPSRDDLNNSAKNEMKVDWVRVYKPVASSSNVAVNNITITPASLILDVGNKGSLTSTVTPFNATVKTMTFTTSNAAVATVNQNGVVTAISNGTTIITATSTDGGFTAISEVTVSTPSGTGNTITIEAETFTSTGGSFNDGLVPLGMNKTTSIVNYVNKQDYATYSLNVSQSGIYSIAYLISTPMDNAEVSIYVDDVLISADLVINNGSWGAYQILNVSNTVSLSSGSHTVRITASGSNNWQWNMDKIVFDRISNIKPKVNENLIIEAESFSSTNGTFNDGLVPFGMNKTASIVNYVNANDSADYTVNISQSGTYFVAYKISTPMNNAKVSIYIDGILISTDNVNNNGSWDNYQTLNAANNVVLNAGIHNVKIIASGSSDWQWNMDKIILTTNSNFKRGVETGAILNIDVKEVNDKIIVYPNPTNNILYVQGKGIKNIKLYNTVGMLIINESSDKSAIDVSKLSDGIYILQLANTTSKITKRIVVKH